MKHTFYLKQPKSKTKSLIYFSCYFKHEAKKFVYSTGEKILPKHWNPETNLPTPKGTVKDEYANVIKTQLGRYSAEFERLENQFDIANEEFTSKILKTGFDEHFKRASTKKDIFFEAYDSFLDEKKMLKVWKPSTAKRYEYLKTHLQNFESEKRYKLTFNKINDSFYTKFLDYCYSDLNHYSNTVARNIGLFKTFMNWSLKKKYHYKLDFKEFKTPKKMITEEVALTLEQVEEIFKLNLSGKDERVRDLFVFQCLTGMRFGDLKNVNKESISDNSIRLKEEKNSLKGYREIPLLPISNYILKKYDYKLPLISNQKQNKYIKEVLKNVDDSPFAYETEYTRIQGVEATKFTEPFYNRIGTHSARRSFITIMRNMGVPDKTIMEITGHEDIRTFNMYHKVTGKSKADAVNKVFGKMELPKLNIA